jgi:hypothetical protein
MPASRRQRRKQRTDTYTVPEAGKRCRSAVTEPIPRPSAARSRRLKSAGAYVCPSRPSIGSWRARLDDTISKMEAPDRGERSGSGANAISKRGRNQCPLGRQRAQPILANCQSQGWLARSPAGYRTPTEPPRRRPGSIDERPTSRCRKGNSSSGQRALRPGSARREAPAVPAPSPAPGRPSRKRDKPLAPDQRSETSMPLKPTKRRRDHCANRRALLERCALTQRCPPHALAAVPRTERRAGE